MENEVKQETRVVPFDLERAFEITIGHSESALGVSEKPKARIRTIKGDPARIICWNKKGNEKMKLVALLDCTTDVTEPVECIAYYNEQGEHSDGIKLLNLCIEEPFSV